MRLTRGGEDLEQGGNDGGILVLRLQGLGRLLDCVGVGNSRLLQQSVNVLHEVGLWGQDGAGQRNDAKRRSAGKMSHIGSHD